MELSQPVGPTAEDKLVEGFVFTRNTLRGHALLLATEPETVLPFLTVEGDSVIQTASSFLAHQLAVALPDDRRTQLELLEVAEVTVRIIVSFVLTPSQNVALGDDDAARSFARRYLVPPLLGWQGLRRGAERHKRYDRTMVWTRAQVGKFTVMKSLRRRATTAVVASICIAAAAPFSVGTSAAEPLNCVNGQFWDPITNTCQTPRPAEDCGVGQYWNALSNVCRPLGQL